jgi:hypothetical protein
MLKLALVVAALFVGAGAQAASLTLPSVTFTQIPAATGITCTQVPAANLVIPTGGSLPAGTDIFDCTVQPTGWTGAVSLSGGTPAGLFVTTPLNANAFSVVLASPVSAPATDTPGTLQVIP